MKQPLGEMVRALNVKAFALECCDTMDEWRQAQVLRARLGHEPAVELLAKLLDEADDLAASVSNEYSTYDYYAARTALIERLEVQP